jgi:hypothetical protein
MRASSEARYGAAFLIGECGVLVVVDRIKCAS